ncbi:MAG TPA: multicopper oxidase domain-containing protein, partial [Ilumatobacteraceae bacterium]|nr:multicopper oxidase domain-containing protein [Ilumatobacteraceae bacterium]
MTGLLVALVGALLVIGIIGLLDDDGDGDGGGGGATATAATTIDVALTEFAIDGSLVAQAGDVNLAVTNSGSQQHDLVVEELGTQTRLLNGGDSDALSLNSVGPGSYTLFCSVPGHRESGMEAELIVSTEPPTGEAAAGGSHGGHGAAGEYDAEARDAKMIASMLAFPTATEGLGNQVLEPEILADGTKRFVLEASVIDWEVAPGEFVEAWAYNGQVPGPQIIVDVGDKVEVELTNNTPLGTDIHWHGISTPNDQDGVAPFTQEPIGVGETFTYEFVADQPRIGM